MSHFVGDREYFPATVALAKERQLATGVRLLWGTANLFSDPRYMNGAATNPGFRVVTHAAAQVKKWGQVQNTAFSR
jgi:xylose isomerase